VEVLSEWLSICPGDAAALTARGEAYAERGSFPQAAADFGKALGLNPEDSRAVRFGLPVFLLCGDQVMYSRARAAALSHVADDGAVIVVGCLLGTGGKELDEAEAVADRLGAADRANRWNCLAKGLAEYRRGHHAEAASWLAAADSDESVRDSDRHACSRFFLASAQSRQGNSENAQANFDIGSDLLQRKTVKPQERNQSDGTLLDWLVCQGAASEARSTRRQ
jgi:tetratricopeptide (TPR) repeat protein